MYITIFVLVYGVSQVSVFGSSLMPFGVGLIFALLLLDYSGYMLAVIYFVAGIISDFGVTGIIVNLNISVVLALAYYLIKLRKIKLKKWMLVVLALLGQLSYIITNLGSTRDNLSLFVSIVLSLFFLFSCAYFFDAISAKRQGFLNLDEKICGAVILILFMFGMSSTNVSIINLGFVFVPLVILLCTYVFPNDKVVVISAILGVGMSLAHMSQMYISLCVVMGLMSISFRCNFRYLSAIAVCLGHVIFTVFFNTGFSWGELLSVVIGGVMFAIIPNSVLHKYNGIFDSKSLLTVKNIVDNSKNQIVTRVKELSKIFLEMDGVYRKMVRGTLPDDKAKVMLREELVDMVCSKCENRDYCFRSSGNFVDNAIDTIVSVAYDKGKILLMDIPQHLTSNCNNTSAIVSSLNSLVSSYKQYTGVINNLDTSRILIANQLNGVSKLLDSLSSEVDVNINFDHKFNDRIKEELSYKNIICYASFVYEKDAYSRYVNLIVKTESIDKVLIEKIVSKIIGVKLMIKNVSPNDADTSMVYMVTKPNFDIAYGSCGITKTGKIVSGDSKSILKIDDGKYMVSICDGMGSGKNAHSISALTISLIENFYKCGFDNDTILNSVNKLLSLTEEENFSTIDLCLIDGKKNTYDFVKLGATTGYLKRENGECEKIESSGLPIGVLEEIRPHITKKLINPFDMLVFVSDGITDSFENKLDLCLYISHLDIINPMLLSQNILDKALSLNSGIAIDDMTVVCVRVFEYE
ncbi:MAG: SpoIIE family protein phosphatase [Eubacteriales bacterium]|nr:SpoIIE family protein phosphatase [Eubacteriales bacterium]